MSLLTDEWRPATTSQVYPATMNQVNITVKINFNNFAFKSFLIEVELEISIEL